MVEEQPQYFSIYQTAWNFHKRHSLVKDNEEYWQNVTSDIEKTLNEAHGKPGIELLQALILAAFSELERVSKIRK